MVNWKVLLFSLAISLGGGAITSFFTMGSQSLYNKLNLPEFSPPSYIFPTVWTILYILMAISSYIIYLSDDTQDRRKALFLYITQLGMSFVWPFIFFKGTMFWFAFVWLIAMFFIILYMIKLFYDINPKAAYLQIPYVVWLIFAGYLNFMVATINA